MSTVPILRHSRAVSAVTLSFAGVPALAAASAVNAGTTTCTGRWSLVPSPSSGNVSNNLYDVDTLAPNDAWAVGTKNSEVGPLFATRPISAHWDGTAWKEVPTANGIFAQFNGVFALGTTDVWAVGADVPDPLSPTPLVEHFDGASWTVVDSPQLAQSNLVSISGTSDKDLWAVGTAHGFRPHMIAMHWNGTAWALSKTPDIDSAFVSLESVTALSRADVWGVGYYLAPNFLDAPFAVHWNGHAWTLVD